MPTYDYIVVGGGSSGCVLANCLSENPAHKVLRIESGRADKDPWIHIPATFFKVLAKGIDIHPYVSEPEKGLNGRPQIVPQGDVLGGGSSQHVAQIFLGALLSRALKFTFEVSSRDTLILQAGWKIPA
ncbi:MULTISPECIES: GMC family oxidoreductase N-terminal domain-containing protein [unclassified Mesorhizobium]|uniref:GMC family oxidoreductase N-terminal domain-containing protein n=1 Tax=unclassified Mesorhizobium TaxID=325217 RepID=UPI001FEDAB3D|nr:MULTISPECIES: GMC family oxidoreductase N-terminal domain-containing protein [unclassified Mesorhizobium]